VALQLGELSIALELDNTRLRTGMAAAKRELEGLPPVAQREMVNVTRVMDGEGRKAGGKLAQGINAGLVRNSPLIVAGITGALAAGAPAVLAGASLMFGGIGIAAATQNDEVRAAFAGLRNLVVGELGAIGQPMADILPTIADQLGTAFLRAEPQIIRAVSAVAPQIQALTGDIVTMGENALPGMVRAAERSGPVMEGLGSFLESTGQGLGDFFDAISEHSPAAGESFEALGQIVGDLLPTLGELLGHGVELATVVLPPLADAMGLVRDVAEDLGPALPYVAAGFLALRAASGLAGGLQSLAGSLRNVGTEGGFVNRSTSGVARGMSALGSALPILGIGLAAAGEGMRQADEQISEFADNLLKGGAAAAETERMFAAIGNSDVGAEVIAKTRAEVDSYIASLSPLEQAQLRVDQAQANVNHAVGVFGENSPQAKAATDDYAAAQATLADEAAKVELAVSGVTQAMIDQANQALAAIDSGFAYQNSLNGLEDAQADLNTALKEHGPNSEEAQRASLALAEQNYRTALAFGQQQADMSGAAEGSAEYARIVQETALQELYRLRDAAGPEMRGALEEQIRMLEASGVSLESTAVQAQATADRMKGLGHEVQTVPGYKGVIIDAPTEDQKQRIRDLGYNVQTLPDGDIYVSLPNAGGVEQDLQKLARARFTSIYVRTVTDAWGTSRPQTAGGANFVGPVQAKGGIVHAYAGGGIELSPMSGGIAQVVAPNTWRVIGDRVTDDEAYIPINQDARSHSILAATAQRMGYGLQEMADGGLIGAAAGGGDLRGLEITGTLAFDPDGMVRIIDGRIVGALTGAVQRARNNA
jgi:hypothetical protein